MRKLVVFLAFFLVPFFVFAQQKAEITYSVHMAGIGWGGYLSDGATAGTTGQKRQLEAMKVKVNSSISGRVRYDVYAAGIGWLGWQFDDAVAGTTGQSRRIEAIRVLLSGDIAKQFEVRYRVHMESIGWSGWSYNGDMAGTQGQSRRIEAIEIKLEPLEQLVSKVSNDISQLNIPGVTVRRVDEGISISVEGANFVADSDKLTPEDLAKLDKIITVLLKSYTDKEMMIAGHTALAGTPEGRMKLSTDRAKFVANYLESKKVRPAGKIKTKGYGAERPIGDNNTDEGKRINRRVEIILLD